MFVVLQKNSQTFTVDMGELDEYVIDILCNLHNVLYPSSSALQVLVKVPSIISSQVGVLDRVQLLPSIDDIQEWVTSPKVEDQAKIEMLKMMQRSLPVPELKRLELVDSIVEEAFDYSRPTPNETTKIGRAPEPKKAAAVLQNLTWRSDDPREAFSETQKPIEVLIKKASGKVIRAIVDVSRRCILNKDDRGSGIGPKNPWDASAFSWCQPPTSSVTQMTS